MKVVWLGAVLVLLGCAHGKMGFIEAPLEPGAISRSTPIFVETVSAKNTAFSGDKADDMTRLAEERAEIESRFSRMIADQLRKRGYNAQVSSAPQTSGVVISGKVSRFEHGSGAARFWLGMGAGSSNLFTDFVIEDRTHRKVLSKFEVIATSGGRGGIYAMGGFIKAHLEDGSAKVAEYVHHQTAR